MIGASPDAEPLALISSMSWDGIATIIAAVLAVVIALIGFSVQQRAARKERLAEIYSEALRAVEDYLEAPYLVRRRDGSAAARQVITTYVSGIQSRLSYYRTLLDIHAHPEVSDAYGTLVSAARSEAGTAMRKAWSERPTLLDRGVSVSSRLDRRRSDVAARTYVAMVKRHV